jgi:3-hydroxyisobutyrate dehydrogenase-like beta-hydroxyacid dehydrogenase
MVLRENSSMATIAFLGLGAMGSRMALRLVNAGFAVTVWNRDSSKAATLGHAGARVASSPRAAVADADLVLSMVTDDGAARAIWLGAERGALAGMKPGAIAIECSPVSPFWIEELHAAAEARTVRLLDAPVAGSRPQAEAGQLIFMIGGDVDAIETARPALQPMAARLIHAGASGQGVNLKLAINALFAAQLASVAELLHFLSRCGFDRLAAADLLGQFPIVAAPVAGAARMMASGSTAPLFTIGLLEKDLHYAIVAAHAHKVALPNTSAVRALFQQAQANGLGSANISGLSAIFV